MRLNVGPGVGGEEEGGGEGLDEAGQDGVEGVGGGDQLAVDPGRDVDSVLGEELEPSVVLSSPSLAPGFEWMAWCCFKLP